MYYLAWRLVDISLIRFETGRLIKLNDVLDGHVVRSISNERFLACETSELRSLFFPPIFLLPPFTRHMYKTLRRFRISLQTRSLTIFYSFFHFRLVSLHTNSLVSRLGSNTRNFCRVGFVFFCCFPLKYFPFVFWLFQDSSKTEYTRMQLCTLWFVEL